MNEILMRKCIKEVMKRGANIHTAKDIAQTVVEMTKGTGKNADKYIEYAITLVYGLKVKTNVK